MPGLYSTTGWQHLRTQQLRLEPTCRLCRQIGRTVPATVADHVQPHRGDRGLFFDRANLQSLCKPCHDGAKQRLEKSGTLPGADLDGMPIDPRHPWLVGVDE